MQNQHFYSNGKLLLSGEYLVLKGAKALALPLKFGQSLEIKAETSTQDILYWKSYQDNILWFEAIFSLPDFTLVETSDQLIANRLTTILKTAYKQNSDFIKKGYSYFATSQLNFDRNWGLGSSSSLINNIANWTKVDPYLLLRNSFGGSGYDIACASADQAIFYQWKNNNPISEKASFSPSFKSDLYFVYLGKKQKSSDSINEFQQKEKNVEDVISEISDISERMAEVQELKEFQNLIRKHEMIISSILQRKRIKEIQFPDFPGEIKSLGGWGGDFILAATANDPQKVKRYFENKKLDIVFKFTDIVK